MFMQHCIHLGEEVHACYHCYMVLGYMEPYLRK